VFTEILAASRQLLRERERVQDRQVGGWTFPRTIIEVGGLRIGAGQPLVIAGPCAVESLEQLEKVAGELRRLGIRVLRGGAVKGRTSPYSFQGLGRQGLEWIQQVARAYGLLSVVEVLDSSQVDITCQFADILQVGSRNMHNSTLLQAVGRAGRPVILKRGFMATLEEFLSAAEHIVSRGNSQVILCERGIRTFEHWTRNTLDIAAVPLLKGESPFPVIVDVSHGTGRKDLAIPMARAALAAGADGIMVEVHPNPAAALSDAQQQLDLAEFRQLLLALGLGSEASQEEPSRPPR
jgi:3-deoxy-7-phosphoheptulonate synthase/chorismate mutase